MNRTWTACARPASVIGVGTGVSGRGGGVGAGDGDDVGRGTDVGTGVGPTLPLVWSATTVGTGVGVGGAAGMATCGCEHAATPTAASRTNDQQERGRTAERWWRDMDNLASAQQRERAVAHT